MIFGRMKKQVPRHVVRVVRVVATVYSLDPHKIFDRGRTKREALGRNIIMYILRSNLSLSYVKIGNIFYRDHTTVMAGCQSVEAQMESRPLLKEQVTQIQKCIVSGGKKKDIPPLSDLDMSQPKVFPPRLYDIVNKTAAMYHVQPEEIFGKSRIRRICFARFVAMYLIRLDLKMSCIEIGNAFHRYHTMALHACKAVENEMEKDDMVRRQIEYIRQDYNGVKPA